ncbi:hypothetical protein P168DRAFT_287593 [Aspergillus campestris IBT 28561]|uniref:Glycoside hydrolase n=1 Tax=Aspergillus campestris (strain IBT 28561) TaxID=1392248 RepID=A0A2I1DB53_ASPC2|nr:uncharacterized protein P168DRAFT_287593 [Aspergillus campestris IBT 28561]PKY07103.1 hypothetical protein P168DRAFT_287593 [Aspergillus campestris IBT 28561]
MFLSLDYSGDGHWPPDQVVKVLKKYTKHEAYYKHAGDGKPLVSTFEGAQASGDWAQIKSEVDCFFMPDWSSVDPKKTAPKKHVDGLMNWSSWPNGTDAMSTALDKEYMDALGDKPFIMGVSPWFYTNMIRWHKNWVWQGDDLWYTRWQQVLDLKPEYVELISWNDYGESHYIGPIHPGSLDVFRYAQAPFNYAENMPHDGWRAFLPYWIDQFKRGKHNDDEEAEIDAGLVAWYRVNPSSRCEDGRTTGNTRQQDQPTMAPEKVLKDRVFFSALLDAPAEVTVSIGGKDTSLSRWQYKPKKGARQGLYHGSVPMNDRMGDVVITLSRAGEELAQLKGHAISDDCTKNLTNWNPWVGHASAKGSKNASEKSSSDEASAAGRESMTLTLAGAALAWITYLVLA